MALQLWLEILDNCDGNKNANKHNHQEIAEDSISMTHKHFSLKDTISESNLWRVKTNIPRGYY